MSEEKLCICCGEVFIPTCHTTRQKFCSAACRIKYHNARRYAPPEETCVNCGASLTSRIQKGRNRRFCSDICREAYYHRKAAEKRRAARHEPRVCPNCGRDFVPVWETGPARFCSDDCRIEWWKEYHRHNPNSEKLNTNCAYCGRGQAGGGKYCSRACYRLGAAHVRGERVCSWCGKLLPKKVRSTQKYCCTACAKAEWRLSRSDGRQRRCIQAKNSGAWRQQLRELAKDLPVEVVVHELPPEKQNCSECGNSLHVMAFEVHEELKIVPAKAVLVKHKSCTYACRHCEKHSDHVPIVKASAPKPVIKGSFAAPETIAHVAYEKFVMGIPLYRQEQDWSRKGIPISRQAISNWLVRATQDWNRAILR